jgi:hypothetical protein
LVVCLVAAAPVLGQGSPGSLPPFPDAAPGTQRPAGPPNGAPPVTEHTLRDLTPDGFGDLYPPPDPHAAHGTHEVPGYLAPLAPGHAGFYGTAEYLLFRPRSGAFDYALLNSTPGMATAGPIESLKYNLGSGFRVEGGYRFGTGWDAGFAYTYFNSGGGASVVAGPGQVVLPTMTRPGLTDTALAASAGANLNYNLYDVLFGKRIAFDDHFAVRAFGGFRFADITQRFSGFYDGLDARSAAVNTGSSFRGFGPLVGGEAVIGGWHGFHLYTRATAGLITGQSQNCVTETNDAGATVYVDTRYGVRKVVPVTSLAIGGGWQYRTFSIRAGYEVTNWFGLTEPVRFVDDVSQGKFLTRPSNFSLDGFFIQLGLTF